MNGIIPEKLNRLAKECPYPLYAVGGIVRDWLAGLRSSKTDIDICAPADSGDFVRRAEAAGFGVKSVYKNTGAVKLCADGEDYEFTCFRSDEYVRGEHTPARTFFTEDITLDARRRDFTCNAVYYDIAAGKITDPLGGAEDIKNKIMRTVAPAEKVFGEDGLRLMRLARISGQTGFLPSAECLDGAKKNAGLVRDVSAERIYAELELLLHADCKYGARLGHYAGLKILEETGVLEIIIPELCAGKGLAQNAKFHKYDVFEHSLRSVAYADAGIRLAALLHDVGKPYCLKEFSAYAGHEKYGAEIALKICGRLKVPKKLAEEVVRLTELHMYDFRCDAKENKIRRFIVENLDIFDKILLLKQADFSACMDCADTAPFVAKARSIYEKMLSEGVPLTVKELAVRGNELIAAGVPAEGTGRMLKRLLADACIGTVANEREALINRAVKCYLPLLKD